MKIIVTRKVKKLGIIAASALLVVVLAIGLAGALKSDDYSDSAETLEQVDQYKVRSELLISAMDLVGVCCPEDTVDVWVTGLEKRNAAMQYAMMNEVLKKIYIADLELNYPNWVTGMSSPWVSGYEVVKTESPDENTRVVKLSVSTATSTGPAGNYNATLTIQKQDDFWRITKLSLDKGLYPYTGFSLK